MAAKKQSSSDLELAAGAVLVAGLVYFGTKKGEADTFTIKATAGNNGAISPSGETKVKKGADITFDIIADEGYKVDTVIVDGEAKGAFDDFTFEKVEDNHTIYVSFVKTGSTGGGTDESGVWTLMAMKDYTFLKDASSTAVWTLMATSTMQLLKDAGSTQIWTLMASSMMSVVKDTASTAVWTLMATGSMAVGKYTATPKLSISPVSASQNTTRTITFSGFTPSKSITIKVSGGGYFTATANASGAGAYTIAFGDAPGNYTLVATGADGITASVDFVVTGTTTGGGTTTTVTPSLSITNSPVTQGKSLIFNFKGFKAGASVTISVAGGGSFTATADASGAGTYSFVCNDAAGSHTLIASDAYGHSASASFTVVASSTTTTVTPSLAVTNSPVTQGKSLVFTFKGFKGSVTIAVTGGGSFTATANSTGSGTYSFTCGDSVGAHILTAKDSYGHSASASFTIVADTTTTTTTKPSLSVTNSPVTQNTKLILTFSGFKANATVAIAVTGGGGFNATASSSGGGTYSFTCGDSPGYHTLTAKDSYGNYASAIFKVV